MIHIQPNLNPLTINEPSIDESEQLIGDNEAINELLREQYCAWRIQDDQGKLGKILRQGRIGK